MKIHQISSEGPNIVLARLTFNGFHAFHKGLLVLSVFVYTIANVCVHVHSALWYLNK